jgi:hypothetical protein
MKLNSIERYLSSIAKDYLFHVYMFPGDIDNMDQEDCEELYEAILDSIDDRDQAKRELILRPITDVHSMHLADLKHFISFV